MIHPALMNGRVNSQNRSYSQQAHPQQMQNPLSQASNAHRNLIDQSGLSLKRNEFVLPPPSLIQDNLLNNASQGQVIQSRNHYNQLSQPMKSGMFDHATLQNKSKSFMQSLENIPSLEKYREKSLNSALRSQNRSRDNPYNSNMSPFIPRMNAMGKNMLQKSSGNPNPVLPSISNNLSMNEYQAQLGTYDVLSNQIPNSSNSIPLTRHSNLINVKDQIIQQQQLINQILNKGSIQGSDNEHYQIEENFKLKKRLNKLRIEKQQLNSSLNNLINLKSLTEPKPKTEEKSSKLEKLNYKIESLSETLKYQAMMNALMQQNQMMRMPQQMPNQQYPQNIPQQQSPPREDYRDLIRQELEKESQQQLLKDNNQRKNFLDNILNEVRQNSQGSVRTEQRSNQYNRKSTPGQFNEQIPDPILKLQAPKYEFPVQKQKVKRPSFLNAPYQQSSRRVKKGSKRYWKAVTVAIMAWFKVRKSLLYKQQSKRNDNLKNLDKAIHLYTEIAQAWLIKAIKQPLLSIIEDQNLNLSIIDNRVDAYEIQNRMLKAKIRVKAIFEGILDHTTMTHMSTPLLTFLGQLFKIGTYIPHGFLSSFEISRLVQLDANATIKNVTEIQVQIILGVFLLVKILVGKVLSSPNACGLKPTMANTLLSYAFNKASGIQKENSRQLQTLNFRIIASLVYFTVMEYIEQLDPIAQGYSLDLVHNAGFKQIIYKQMDVKEYYKDENYGFRSEMFGIIDNFLQNLTTLVKANSR
eukprot:403331114